MAMHQFKAESKKLMDLMINSIYTNRDIFLRELISNASDACDKRYFKSLTDTSIGITKDDLKIHIQPDKEARTLTITDNGIGMTKEDLEKNLGTIAKSGSLDFKRENETGEDVEVIGQFGVGFYSAFMVADHVTVESRAWGEEIGSRWESSGAEGYTIEPCEMDWRGTRVTLHLKDDTEDEKYSEFLEEYRLSELVKKYSDYIRYPITLLMPQYRPKAVPEGEEAPEKPEYETVWEETTLNSMIPLWRKQKSEVKPEEYNDFYKNKFYDYEDPAVVIHTRTEGNATFNALLFIPSHAPMNYYSTSYEKGLQLYSRGVLIMEKCADLLPDYFSFVRGLVDSEDLSLNISREMLQHDRQLKTIAKNIEKKIRAELTKLMKDDRAKYEEFFNSFGLQLKYGVYADFGLHKDDLKDLILFHSLKENKLVSLKEYVEQMAEDQKYIYYACGETVAKISSLPQTDAVREKGYDILCMTDDVDEFAVKILGAYEEKTFKSVSDKDLGLETEEEKAEIEKKAEENKALLEGLSKALDGKVKEVRLSSRLKTHPVCLISDGELSLEMEKVLNAMPNDRKVKAERVLEINAEHPVFQALAKAYAADSEQIGSYASLLYDQALLMAGMTIEDPVAFSNAICELMTQAVS